MAEKTELDVALWEAALNRKKAALQQQIASMTGQVRDIDVQLRGIRERVSEVEAELAKTNAEEERERVTLRSTMTAVLAELGDFNNALLVQEIQRKYPGAKPESIFSELSKAISERGEAVRVSDGVFKGKKAMPQPQGGEQSGVGPNAASAQGPPGAPAGQGAAGA